MTLTEMIHQHYSTDTYIDAMKDVITGPEDSVKFEMRYHQWMYLHGKKLKDIYIKRIMTNNEDACSMSWLTWSRFCFFVFEENTRVESTLKKEMNDLLGED